MKISIQQLRKLLVAALCILSVYTVQAQESTWPPVKKEMKPWLRWWWMGNAVNEQTLSQALTAYQAADVGGVEIAPIYGAIGHENEYIDYLSPRWMQMLDHTVTTAHKLGMGVDLTTGTGWPFGGPQVTKPYAASRMIIQKYQVKAGTPFKEKILINDRKQEGATLQALTAYNGGKTVQLKDKVNKDGTLQWTPTSGNWELYALFSGKTRQMVKRAAPGGEGFTLDHLSAAALKVYLSRFDSAFHQQPPGVRAFYNDSYEVYGADWTPDFPEQFQRHRGYDLKNYIRELTGNDSTELTARVKSDYRETMSELLLENFTRPWTKWAHQYAGVTKNQAHGSPGNLLDLYAAVDIPECETFGSTSFPIPGLRRDSADIRNVDPDPVMLKFASSAAHVAGHPLVSCETFTWLTEHFKTSLSQCKPEVEQCFLAGVNHVFYHGTTFSPPQVPWPGWLFYASVNFVQTNSWWPHLPGLNQYISRVQSVLQSGLPDNELLIYWPVYDAWNNAKGKDMPLKVHDIDEWLHPTPFYKQVTTLQKAGYSLDFISDRLLDKATVKDGMIITGDNTSPYKVLIVPTTGHMPLTTLQKITALAKQGATIILQSLPEDVPGLHRLDNRRQQMKTLLTSLHFPGNENGLQVLKTGKGQLLIAKDVQQALDKNGIKRETLTDAGLQFIRRKTGSDTYYYIVNHTAKAVDQYLPVNADAAGVIIMDPQTGSYGNAFSNNADGRLQVKVQLLPGESLILRACHQPEKNIPAWVYLDNASTPVTLNGNWQLQFKDGGPFKPAAVQLSNLTSWTTLSDTAAHTFSGTGQYELSFSLPALTAKEYVLDLGKVHESARVWINGKDAGIMWSIPFRRRIGELLKTGNNTIRIEVANLMANRIRYMDQHKIPWRRYHEINFVNINYKDFDAAGWQLQPSGLIGPVTITPYQ